MAKGLQLSDTVLANGQNEGIERAVLPLPQLSYVQNARMRKTGRWGKRWGHINVDTTYLGTGTGNIRCVGGAGNSGFAIVDDACNSYSSANSQFVNPAAVTGTLSTLAYRIQRAVSGWLPGRSFFPAPARSFQRQTTTPCGSCYALGALWTVIQYENPLIAGDQNMLVVATDPNDQTLIFAQDFAPTTTGFGGNFYPKLIACGNTVVLTYMSAIGAGNYLVAARSCTSLASTFGAETALTGAGVSAYDSSGYSSTQFLVGVASAANVNAIIFNASPLTLSVALAGTEVALTCSIVGSAASGVFLAYNTAAPATKVAVFTAALAALTGTAAMSGFSVFGNARPLITLKQTTGARVVMNPFFSTAGANPSYGVFRIRDVTAAAAPGARTLTQRGLFPRSQPFAIGAAVYLWTHTEVSNNGRYATLITLPDPAGVAADSDVSCPLEMTVQDYITSIDAGQVVPDLNGLPAVTKLGSTAYYAVPVPTLYTLPGGAVLSGHDFRILQTKHYTDVASARSVQALYADSSSFAPMGAITVVDDRGASELGFVHAPGLGTPVPAAGAGSLTPSSDYYYTAVFKTRNSLGRYQQSAPIPPVKITMGVGQNQNSLSYIGLELSAKTSSEVEIYRTLSNGQTYYLNGIYDSTLRTTSVLDQMSDAVLSAQPALYIQVGQTLPNVPPPGARFGCVGGQRLWLGGLIRADLVQCSKLIFGDQSPSFADNDAFRIVLPSDCTGIAWMDAITMFTSEGIYIATGDGPDDSGIGDFGGLTRLPFALGCIEPRSVVTIDDGTFFQTSRGLYLLPRGFGTPVPAGDMVMDTLAAFPVITGNATLVKATEQSVHWTCVNTAGTAGRRIVYDLAHKAWSIDTIAEQTVGFTSPMSGTGQWLGGEVAIFGANTSSGSGIQSSSSAFVEAQGTATIPMLLRTGDVRPFGSSANGIVERYCVLGELRSACTVQINTVTDQNVAAGPVGTSRAFALAGGDTQVGQNAYIQADMGQSQRRDVTSVQIELSESSGVEGFAFISIGLETGPNEGMRKTQPADRIT
jgi:hypothetical protein